jgi:dephospho-CoA kinase
MGDAGHVRLAARPPDRPLTPVIVGPTAVGKTAVAMSLAQRLPVTIISADARQVYRRLDIGTAKPAPALRALVPHEGLDLVDPGERYSAGRFAREAAGRPGRRAPAARRGRNRVLRARPRRRPVSGAAARSRAARAGA